LNHEGAKSAKEREGKKDTLFPIFVSFRVPSGQYSWFNPLSVFLCVLCVFAVLSGLSIQEVGCD